MCTVPPPPPPPLLAEQKPPKSFCNSVNDTNYDTNICQWAINYPELREACIKNNICLHEPPYKYKYKHVNSIIQEGPTCGLVALSMLLGGNVSPAEILSIAKSEGYTNRGEMFSCKNMVQLAEKVFSLADIDNVRLLVQNGELYSEEVVNKVLEGAMLLVPYNADLNHAPSPLQGYRAHWTVICGIIIVKKPIEYLLHPSNIFALCKQGKSKNLMLWSWRQIYKSNGNLSEFPQKMGANGPVYVLPNGGVVGENGLKDQFVLIEGL